MVLPLTNTTEKEKGEDFKRNIMTYSYISLLEILQNTIKKRKKVNPGGHAVISRKQENY